MSTDRQEHSIDDQRKAVHAYADRNGFSVIREYLDEGISGDATEKRHAFRKMLADAEALGDFEAVLCWDQDRFGRFDPLEAGYWVKPLRDRGVRLETVAQGRIDWEDFAGRIVYAVQQEAKHAYLRDLSRNVLRGMLRVAEGGNWNGGRRPYGYRVEGGRLVPGDPAEVEVVRWLFRTYATTERGVRWLACDLNARGVPSPSGRRWRPKAVWDILTRRLYTGDMVWNRRHEGKYHGVEAGAIKAERRRKTVEFNPAGDLLVTEGTHEPLIDRATWELVCRRLSAQGGGRPHVATGGFFLVGLARCGHCKGAMYGCNFRRKGGPDDRRLVCSTYHSMGRALCEGGRLDELPLVRVVVRRVQEDFLDPRNLKTLRDGLARRLRERRAGDPGEERRLRQQLADLTAQVERGAGRVLEETDPALVPVLRAKLREWQDRQAELAARLEALARDRVRTRDEGELVERAVAGLWALQKRLGEAEPAKLRAVVREVVTGAELYFRSAPYGANRTRRLFEEARVGIRLDVEVIRDVPIGLPMETTARLLRQFAGLSLPSPKDEG
jgi:DNA invertase Pin-like site-specific DNA recombinase